MKKRFTLLCLLGLLVSFAGKAQQDSAFKLLGVTIVEYGNRELGKGSSYRSIDSSQKSIFQQRDLSTLLSEQSLVFVRSQGPGNLASTSIRGAGSQHTAVVWNGLNLNNSMNGIVDLSIIPNALFDNIGVQYGASTSLWGSGALGGAIHIQNNTGLKQALKLNLGAEFTSYDEIGSLNGKAYNLEIRQGSDKLAWCIKLNHLQNTNEFLFSEENQILSSRLKNENASFSNSGLSGDLFWSIKPNHHIDVHYWLQNLNRNVPPTLLERNSNANLLDESHRLAINYKSFYSFGLLGFRTGYFNKSLLFSSDNLEDAPSKSESIINEVYYLLNIDNKYNINLGLNNNFNMGRHKNYAEIVDSDSDELFTKSQNLFAVYSSLDFQNPNNKLSYSFSFRQEWRDRDLLPFTFDLGGEYQLFNYWNIGLRVSKMYRVPNLNDLYWNPGGNPDLKAESGYSSELSSDLQLLKSKKWLLNVNYSGFYRRIDNWIQWSPGIVWSPQNLLEVESFGNEGQMLLKFSLSKLSISSQLSYSYTISQNIKTNFSNSASLDKQLIYTPINQAFGNVNINYDHWNLNFSQQYVGYVYTASDHSQFIEPVHNSNLRLQYAFLAQKQKMSFWFGVNNIFNQDCQYVYSRPMPLRTFIMGFNMHLTSKKSNTKK